jgi:hypothetical protein
MVERLRRQWLIQHSTCIESGTNGQPCHLLDTSLLHLEHPEPRIRTLVANAVGTNDAFLVLNHKLGNTNSADDQHYNRLASSIEEHNMERGREVPATDSPEAQKEELHPDLPS